MTDPARRVLPIEPLDAQRFKAYGDVIEAADRASPFTINEGWAQRFDDLARIDPAHLLPAARLAQSILRRRWDDVERVAAALQPGRTLRGQALRRALGGKP